MPSLFEFASMVVQQQLSKHTLARVVEPDLVTAEPDNVAQYDQVMSTKLVIAYGTGLGIISRALGTGPREKAVDIACGPGHFTLCLARFLDFGSVFGIDLSAPMIEIARRNAAHHKAKTVAAFQTGDATSLDEITPRSYDLATFTDAAHHMPSLGVVTSVIREMNRITKPDGLIFVIDLVRLKTASLTDQYVKALGYDYIERGLPNFYDDFRNSMYAAWTAEEFRSAIPRDTERYWCHIVPRGLPTIQVVLGLPVGRKKPFVRRGVPWTTENCPIPRDMRVDWRMLRATLALASKTIIPPGR